MNERQKRLIEVYDHLRRYFGVHTKTEFAEAVHYGRTSMSAALNGDEKYLTDSLFKNICEAYQGVFDLNYLLTGKGFLLATEEEVQKEDSEKSHKPQSIELSSLVNAALAAKDETIESLKERIADLQRNIADKEDMIKARDARILSLERQLAVASTSDLSHYPFTMGAADEEIKHKREQT